MRCFRHALILHRRKHQSVGFVFGKLYRVFSAETSFNAWAKLSPWILKNKSHPRVQSHNTDISACCFCSSGTSFAMPSEHFILANRICSAFNYRYSLSKYRNPKSLADSTNMPPWNFTNTVGTSPVPSILRFTKCFWINALESDSSTTYSSSFPV